ncbi:MAG: hypothetical protein GXP26_01845 [Planctomycetes bacterium]|nr:hypothetical protein [Planctomycetota bacterium]
MPSDWPPQFLFTICQCGAEQALKREIATRLADARPAFSRPGFVTFKLGSPCEHPEQFQLPSTFARTYGFSLGKFAGTSTSELAKQVWETPAIARFVEAEKIGDIHTWQRDRATPGSKGFEPGQTLLAQEVERGIRQLSPIESLHNMPASPRPPSRRNSWVLDVVLVEPNEWWIGCHRTTRRFDCWPGGVPPLELPEHAVSRSYLKMAESLEWSALPILRGDLCLELGCAPGGAAQALLDRGARVIGVDPAVVDPEVCQHPNFQHLRRRSAEVSSRRLRGVHWLAADMSVAPSYTLDAVEDIVTNKARTIRGMVLTLKLSDWKLAEQLPEYIERVRSWGYRDVRTRQLAFNRQEVCLVALRSRGQRRVQRQTRTRCRMDSTHASTPKPPHLPANM